MKIMITVDVEDFFYPRPPSDVYFGKIHNDYWGITKIMDICEKYGVKATFFIDIYNVEGYVDEGIIEECCQEINRREHEVAIHTHPPKRYGKAFINDRVMSNYDYDFQYRFIMKGAERIQKWVGKWPKSHRAGSYAINPATFQALNKARIYTDSSLFPKRNNYAINEQEISNCSNTIFKIGDILEIPITIYKFQARLLNIKIFSMVKKLDINWGRINELSTVIYKLINVDASGIVLFLHSYSLILTNRWIPNYSACERFNQLLSSCIKKGCEFIKCGDIPRNSAHTPIQIPLYTERIGLSHLKEYREIYFSKRKLLKLIS